MPLEQRPGRPQGVFIPLEKVGVRGSVRRSGERRLNLFRSAETVVRKERDLPPHSIGILAGNVLYRNPSNVILEDVREVSATRYVDVAFMQEVTPTSPVNPSSDIPKLILQELSQDEPGTKMVYAQARSFRPFLRMFFDRGACMVEGEAFYTKLNPIAEPKIISLSKGGRAPFKGGADSQRVAIEVTVTPPDGEEPLTILGIHASYNTPFNRRIREEEEQRILSLIRDRKRLILIGDLNARPNSPLIQKISEVLLPGNDLTQPTWTSQYFDGRGFLKATYDYVFTSSDVNISHLEIIPTHADHRWLYFVAQ